MRAAVCVRSYNPAKRPLFRAEIAAAKRRDWWTEPTPSEDWKIGAVGSDFNFEPTVTQKAVTKIGEALKKASTGPKKASTGKIRSAAHHRTVFTAAVKLM